MTHTTVAAAELRLSEAELASRLGCPVGELPLEIYKCIDELRELSEPSFSAVRVKVISCPDGVLLGGRAFSSKALKKVLCGCGEALVLCATLGFGAERLLRKHSATSPTAHFLLDCAADAMVEALCDAAEGRVLGDAAHTARFSPGYADLPLSHVRDILDMTMGDRLLGISLNESFMATPSKTVTAIIGIKNEEDYNK